MSNNQQNGRQPPLPQQKVPSTAALTATAVIQKNKSSAPTDPRIRNVNVAQCAPSNKQIKKCRDFVWGICMKGAQCKFSHELEIESMKDILKFCHDHQNRTGCTRPDCTYLHTSREEENLFLTTGQIPRALAERYAAVSAAQTNMFVGEYIQAPPPPPPPPLPPSAAAPPPPLPATLPPLLAPPPPPPPPPPPAPPTTSAVRMAPPVFSAPPPFNTPAMFVSQPPPRLLPMFDASRPPPPFPNKTGSIKRAGGPFEAGPSKARKPECSKVVETLCDPCMQQDLRMELKRQEMQLIEADLDFQTILYEQKMKRFRDLRNVLVTATDPDLGRFLVDYVEGSTHQVPFQGLLSQLTHQNTQLENETSTVPRQFLLQLMGCVLKQRPVVEAPPVPSVVTDESSLLQSLTALTRRSNPISHTSTDTSVLQALLEVIRNSSTLNSDRNQTNESRTKETNISSSAANGFSHFVNGQKVESGPSAAVASSSGYPTSTKVAVRTYSSGTAGTMSQSAAHMSTASHLPNASHPPGAPRPPSAVHPPSGPHPPNAPHPLSVRAVATPATYLPYQPAVPPPPNRVYYSQPYPTTSNHAPNIHQSYPNSSARVAVTPQVPPRPSTSTAPPVQNTQTYNPYFMGRYPPQPHNYPPFQ